jgi:hypothetical protein
MAGEEKNVGDRGGYHLVRGKPDADLAFGVSSVALGSSFSATSIFIADRALSKFPAIPFNIPDNSPAFAAATFVLIGAVLTVKGAVQGALAENKKRKALEAAKTTKELSIDQSSTEVQMTPEGKRAQNTLYGFFAVAAAACLSLNALAVIDGISDDSPNQNRQAPVKQIDTPSHDSH